MSMYRTLLTSAPGQPTRQLRYLIRWTCAPAGSLLFVDGAQRARHGARCQLHTASSMPSRYCKATQTDDLEQGI